MTLDKTKRTVEQAAPLRAAPGPTTVLVVGLTDVDLPQLPEGAVPRSAHLHFVLALGVLEQDVLREISPAMVISPLMCGGFDAHDVAARLQGCGYQGVFRVLTPALPRIDMVQGELARVAPSLKLDFHTV